MPLGSQLAAMHVDEVADRRQRVEGQSGGTGQAGLWNELRDGEDSDDRRDRRDQPRLALRSVRLEADLGSVRLQADLVGSPSDEQSRAVRHRRHTEQQAQGTRP